MAVLISIALLAACSSRAAEAPAALGLMTGSGGGSSAGYNYDVAESVPFRNEMATIMPFSAPAPESPAEGMQTESAGDAAGDIGSAASGEVPAGTTQTAAGGLAEKIIYSAYAEIETVEFDETIDKVHEMLNLNGAFIENSYIGGRNYAQSRHGYQAYRSARFTLRVPQERLASMTESLSMLGNVIVVQNDAQNITSQFFDTQSRLTALRTEEESLLNMLAKAETVADMIIIVERLSEVRYGIESLTSTLRNWQNQIDYSTLSLHIQEVEVFTEIQPIHRTYWQQIGDGLQGSIRAVGMFFMDLFRWIIVSLPVLIILAVIAAAVAIIVRSKIRKARKRKESADEQS